jgi:hypothetical protein
MPTLHDHVVHVTQAVDGHSAMSLEHTPNALFTSFVNSLIVVQREIVCYLSGCEYSSQMSSNEVRHICHQLGNNIVILMVIDLVVVLESVSLASLANIGEYYNILMLL